MSDIEIVRYTPELKNVWNDFVESSKNGTFLFNRNYMDYHSDRFEDFSFLFYKKGKLYCVLPANIKDSTLYSHQGLTFGGLIMNDKCSAQGILDVFDVLRHTLIDEDISSIIYKPGPYIYHSIPADEDLYAIFRHHALLINRTISSTIDLKNPLKFNRARKESLRHAQKAGIMVKETSDLENFWKILQDNLAGKYGVNPVHTLKEMEHLKSLFPENIKLYAAYLAQEMVGGVLCYVYKDIVHTQYISASAIGKQAGAIDAIIKELLDNKFRDFRYFDFGNSNENGGWYLNESLIWQKEGFGGRAVCYDTYDVTLFID